MTSCIKSKCIYCKHFNVNMNRFESYYVCGCSFYKKYMTKIYDVTLITPDILLNVGIEYL